jgi:hypothetical protein
MTKLIELIINEEEDLFGVDAISLVEFPAIEENFIFLKEDKSKFVFAHQDEEKKMLIGPALIPNKHIYRYDQHTGEEFFVHFTKDTVRKASELFLKENKHKNHTIEHEAQIGGLTVVESWIIEDPENDKANHYGFKLPKGTWMVSIKVESDNIWETVKSGAVKGFSIEGYFVDKMNMSKNQSVIQEIEEIEKIIEGIKA